MFSSTRYAHVFMITHLDLKINNKLYISHFDYSLFAVIYIYIYIYIYTYILLVRSMTIKRGVWNYAWSRFRNFTSQSCDGSLLIAAVLLQYHCDLSYLHNNVIITIIVIITYSCSKIL